MAKDISTGRYFWLSFGLVVFAVLLRGWLIYSGGQFSSWDESRYNASRAAADQIMQGQVLGGLGLATNGGDHVGFKLLGLLPALVESRFGNHDRIPAVFFATFSVASILLLGSIGQRLGMSREARLWSMTAAATSACLLMYSRHMFPYDASLATALWALCLGLRQNASYLRSCAVGFLASCTLLIYMGYWTMAGTVVLLHLLWQDENLRSRFVRILTAAFGFVCPLLLILGINRLGSGHLLEEAKAFSTTINQGDYAGHWMPWVYLFHTEGLLLFLWLLALGAAAWFSFHFKWSDPSARRFMIPLIGLMVVYGSLILASTVMHKFVVYGRLDRQMAPFLILIFGLATEMLFEKLPSVSALGRATFAALLVVNGLLMAWPLLTQEFPKDFRARGEKLIAQLPAAAGEPGSTYLRYVNVDNFVWEPEVLRDPPLETYLTARHPTEYLPSQYDGLTAGQRTLRRSIDHRMRLVRMAVRPEEMVQGEQYGMVEMIVQFPGHRQGFSEPLLAIGPRRNGDLFFIRFEAGHQAYLGCESMGLRIIRSAPFLFEPDRTYRLRLFSGSLLPPNGSAKSPFRARVFAALDNDVLLDDFSSPHAALPSEVFAGINTIEADSALAQFSGKIQQVVRQGLPPPLHQPLDSPNDNSADKPKLAPPVAARGVAEPPPPLHQSSDSPNEYGSFKLRLSLPVSGRGAPEPLLVAGEPGRAVLVYLRCFPDGRILVGADVWGIGTFESQSFKVAQGKSAEMTISFGSLYPPIGIDAWGAVSRAEQARRKERIVIRMANRILLDVQQHTPDLEQTAIYLGKNPVGGSVVGADFSGKIISAEREWPVPN